MDHDPNGVRRPAPRPHTNPDASPESRLLFLWLVLASLLSLGGVLGFILLFVRDMTVYWFILSPLIIIVYQFPAFVVFRIWKRKRGRGAEPDETAPEAPAPPQAVDGGTDSVHGEGNGMPGGPAQG
jgi:hypothetical protein